MDLHPVINANFSILGQLDFILNEITENNYVLQVESLSGATIGQHTRHILDMYLQLEVGYANGMVNYDKRERPLELEQRIDKAQLAIAEITSWLEKGERALELNIENPSGAFQVHTTYFRELQYCMEHAIHHLALIKVALKEIPGMAIPENLGVAFSTLAFKSS